MNGIAFPIQHPVDFLIVQALALAPAFLAYGLSAGEWRFHLCYAAASLVIWSAWLAIWAERRFREIDS